MEPFRVKHDPAGPCVEVPYRGHRLMRHPMFNKGTAFTRDERAALGLEGLLPDHVSTMEEQERRAFRNIMCPDDPLLRYCNLAALQDRNEVLFYRVLTNHIAELMPIVYTPTVGKACQEYSHIFRRARGMWITPAHRGRVEEVLANAPFEDVRLIVVTDNERILGLGDQGAGGMGIPIGKLALYTAAAGIHPCECLPISLDVGTDNQKLLDDELYLGWRRPRLRGDEYYAFVDEFVHAVKYRFPKAILQWEDFKKTNAFTLVDRYRKVLTSFNDDIEGTAAVGTAGVVTVARETVTPLTSQRIVILGSGAAGIGIARLLRARLRREGLDGDDLIRAIACIDLHGLLVDDEPVPEPQQVEFAWPAALAEQVGLGAGRPRDLMAVIRALKPTVLIGTSGEPGVFSEVIVREMASEVARPAFFIMSNPNSKAEAKPADIIQWTSGRALVATGSPFEPVSYAGRTIHIAQANNAFVFPGVGLGLLVSQATEVTPAMFSAAAEALAGEVEDEDLETGLLFPPVRHIRRVATSIAEAVVREARNEGLGADIGDAMIPDAVRAAMWEPAYPRVNAA